MNYEGKNISSEWMKIINKFPAFRLLKAPVFHVHQLYKNKTDGLESGSFAFVISKFCFYGWDFDSKQWKKIGLTREDLKISWEDILDRPIILTIDDVKDLLNGYVSEAPKDGKSYVRNNGVWIEGIEEAPKDGMAYLRCNGVWIEGVEEAPKDGKTYVRQNGQWIVCECGGDSIVGDAPTISLNPTTLTFNKNGESKNVSITLSDIGIQYTVIELPSWLTLSNQTQTGFTLTATINPDAISRSVILTAQLIGFENFATLQVIQNTNN